MDFSFDSVGKFLQQVRGAKAKQREIVEQELDPWLSDPATFATPVQVGMLIDEAVEKYGDEALRQICIVTLGKWIEFHRGFLQEHVNNEAVPEALLTATDMTRLHTALNLLEEVGSFGGDDDYRAAMKEEINQAVLEKIEETGTSPEDYFNGKERESDNLF